MRRKIWRLAGFLPAYPTLARLPLSESGRVVCHAAAAICILLLAACGGSGNEPTRQPFSRTGSGNQVFDMPSDVDRVRITASFSGQSSNFIVWISNELIVNELLGTTWGTTYSGTHQVRGGVTRIEESTGVNWTITEIQ